MTTALMISLPIVLIALSVYFAIKRMSSTHSTKKGFAVNLATFFVLILMVAMFAVPVFASSGDAANDAAVSDTQTVETVDETTEASSSSDDSDSSPQLSLQVLPVSAAVSQLPQQHLPQ